MAKNKKLARAIRGRQARTGESYSTARMHVIASVGGELKPTGFRAVVDDIITLASSGVSRDGDGDDGAFPVVRLADVAPGRTSTEQALRDRLSRLDYAELRKLEILLYAGRGDDTVLELVTSLQVDTPDDTVRVLLGKAPVLAEYLAAGLDAATTARLDLDIDWVLPTEFAFRVRPFEAVFGGGHPALPVLVVTGVLREGGLRLFADGQLMGQLPVEAGGRDVLGPWVVVPYGEGALDTGVPFKVDAEWDDLTRRPDGTCIHIHLKGRDEHTAALSVTFDRHGRCTGGGAPARKLTLEQLQELLA